MKKMFLLCVVSAMASCASLKKENDGSVQPVHITTPEKNHRDLGNAD